MLGTQELDAFISRSFTGIVSVLRENGMPASSMVSCARIGDGIYFSTTLDRLKGRCLQRDPRVVICIVNEREPNSYASLEGSVVIHRDNPKHLHEQMFAFWAPFTEGHPRSVWALYGRAGLEKMWAQPGRAIFEIKVGRVSGVLV